MKFAPTITALAGSLGFLFLLEAVSKPSDIATWWIEMKEILIRSHQVFATFVQFRQAMPTSLTQVKLPEIDFIHQDTHYQVSHLRHQRRLQDATSITREDKHLLEKELETVCGQALPMNHDKRLGTFTLELEGLPRLLTETEKRLVEDIIMRVYNNMTHLSPKNIAHHPNNTTSGDANCTDVFLREMQNTTLSQQTFSPYDESEGSTGALESKFESWVACLGCPVEEPLLYVPETNLSTSLEDRSNLTVSEQQQRQSILQDLATYNAFRIFVGLVDTELAVAACENSLLLVLTDYSISRAALLNQTGDVVAEYLPGLTSAPGSVGRNLGERDEYGDEDYLTLEYLNYKAQVGSSHNRFLKVTQKDDRNISTALKEYEEVPTGDLSQSKTAVIFSAPTTMDPTEGKNWMYLKNFEYFLDHGIDCMRHDTYFVMTPETAIGYQERIEALLKPDCLFNIIVLEREDKCYDMESMNMFLKTANVDLYDFFVYINCGMVSILKPPNCSRAFSF
jgi:hypothetical protein